MHFYITYRIAKMKKKILRVSEDVQHLELSYTRGTGGSIN